MVRQWIAREYKPANSRSTVRGESPRVPTERPIVEGVWQKGLSMSSTHSLNTIGGPPPVLPPYPAPRRRRTLRDGTRAHMIRCRGPSKPPLGAPNVVPIHRTVEEPSDDPRRRASRSVSRSEAAGVGPSPPRAFACQPCRDHQSSGPDRAPRRFEPIRFRSEHRSRRFEGPESRSEHQSRRFERPPYRHRRAYRRRAAGRGTPVRGFALSSAVAGFPHPIEIQ